MVVPKISLFSSGIGRNSSAQLRFINAPFSTFSSHSFFSLSNFFKHIGDCIDSQETVHRYAFQSLTFLSSMDFCAFSIPEAQACSSSENKEVISTNSVCLLLLIVDSLSHWPQFSHLWSCMLLLFNFPDWIDAKNCCAVILNCFLW